MAEELQWCRAVIDERTGLSRCAQLASDNAFVGVEVDVIVGKKRLKSISGNTELGFNDTLLGSGLYGLYVCTVADKQSDGAENDTLSCSGLSGYN